jgi:hypothetical protein
MNSEQGGKPEADKSEPGGKPESEGKSDPGSKPPPKAESEAFSRGMDEIDRVWKTADQFDAGAVQFLGIVSAGALAAAAILADKFPPPFSPFWLWTVVGFVTAGVGLLVTFVVFAIKSTLVGSDFAGPIDPRLIDEDLLHNDDAFKRRALPGVKEAFKKSLDAYQEKRKVFRLGLWILFWAVACFAAAGITSILVTAVGRKFKDDALRSSGTNINFVIGGGDMSKDKEETTAPQPKPAESTTSPLGPYEISRDGGSKRSETKDTTDIRR